MGFDGKKVGEYKNFEGQLIPCPSVKGAFLFVKIKCISRTNFEYAIIMKIFFFLLLL